jgi:hypothetical protein
MKIAIDKFKEQLMHVLRTLKFRECAKKYSELIRSYGGVNMELTT